MEQVALDTNIAIDVLNQVQSIIEELRKYERIYLPVTVSGELLFGAKNSAKRQKNLSRFRAYIGTCEEIPIDNMIAEAYSDIRLSLKQKGTPIPENDIWIAATCQVNGLKLLTRDQHFRRVEGLEVEILDL